MKHKSNGKKRFVLIIPAGRTIFIRQKKEKKMLAMDFLIERTELRVIGKLLQ